MDSVPVPSASVENLPEAGAVQLPKGTMSTLQSKTTAGLFEFCDYMHEKGYATTGAMEPWKTAAKKILSAVDPEGYEQMDLSTADLDDIQRRFETLTLSDYKYESQVTYGKRLRNAVTAY